MCSRLRATGDGQWLDSWQRPFSPIVHFVCVHLPSSNPRSKRVRFVDPRSEKGGARPKPRSQLPVRVACRRCPSLPDLGRLPPDINTARRDATADFSAPRTGATSLTARTFRCRPPRIPRAATDEGDPAPATARHVEYLESLDSPPPSTIASARPSYACAPYPRRAGPILSATGLLALSDATEATPPPPAASAARPPYRK